MKSVMTTADKCRREAAAVEDLARLVSLFTDKDILLAQAENLRRRAEEMDAGPGRVGNSVAPPHGG